MIPQEGRRIRPQGPQGLMEFIVECPPNEKEKSPEGSKESESFRATELKGRETLKEEDSLDNGIREVKQNDLRNTFRNCTESLKTFGKGIRWRGERGHWMVGD